MMIPPSPVRPELERLLKEAVERFKSMSPDEQEAMLRKQRGGLRGMICTLCMSRKHRASHCPMKPQGIVCATHNHRPTHMFENRTHGAEDHFPDAGNMIAMTVRLEPREDGGLRAYCDAVPGFYLSGADPDAVRRDIEPAIAMLMKRNAPSHGVHPGDTPAHPGDERNIHVENDLMLRTPSITHPMLHIRSQK